MTGDLGTLRNDYGNKGLSEKEIPSGPFVLLEQWLEQALRSRVYEPTAMVLSTHGISGFPESRVVLLKGVEKGELLFFTNYRSAKGIQIERNNHVSLLFFWPELHRQIRVAGIAAIITPGKSDKYFSSRPFENRIGAWASDQSKRVRDRNELETAFKEMHQKYSGKEADIPRPPHWGGYSVKPVKFEFWQGRSGRLHDRIIYEASGKQWEIYRLSP